MGLEYRVNAPLSMTDFVSVLKHSSLGERRPIEDVACLEGMLVNSNLIVSVWDGVQCVGIARSVTDFHYACYLSDLAVDKRYQRQGIGKKLQQITRQELGPKCRIILLAAPAANDYYAPLGYDHQPRCWVLEPGSECD